MGKMHINGTVICPLYKKNVSEITTTSSTAINENVTDTTSGYTKDVIINQTTGVVTLPDSGQNPYIIMLSQINNSSNSTISFYPDGSIGHLKVGTTDYDLTTDLDYVTLSLGYGEELIICYYYDNSEGNLCFKNATYVTHVEV